MTEKLTAVQQLGTTNFWIATHKWGTAEFYVYNLSSAGLQATPVISNVGIVHSDTQQNFTYGQMKFNVCGNKIALAAGYLDTVEVFDFNNATGIVSNPITLPLGYHVYGVEFSKNSHLLYVTTYNPSATLVPFDLTSGSAATILASQTVLSATPDMYGLQFSNDGKIYASRTVSPWLGVINSPETVGINCNYVDNGVNLDPNGMGIYSMIGLPALVSSYLRGESFCNVSIGIDEATVSNDLIPIYPNPSANNFTIQFTEATVPSSINIYDESGRLVENMNSFSPNTRLTFGKSLAAGIYFVALNNQKGSSFKRIAKF